MISRLIDILFARKINVVFCAAKHPFSIRLHINSSMVVLYELRQHCALNALLAFYTLKFTDGEAGYQGYTNHNIILG